MPYTGVAIMCYASRVYLKRDNLRLIQEKIESYQLNFKETILY